MPALPPHRLLPLLGAALVLPILAAAPAGAQMSPNCRRNGQPAACAMTPGESDARRSVVTVVFADNSAWRLEKQEDRCRQGHPVISCPAVITGANGNGTPLSGRYRGIWYEGGYRHLWSAPGISIEYVFLD
ncbi:MAG: hypothetical protein VKO65_03210 [Cyanobacteriota bacterium]|nr:hypothetical protein [Cyanobacteriota bacterium]